LITDFYAYNTSVQRGAPLDQPQMLGLHWVGDLMLECRLEITKSDGKALLELVKGGRHFRCEIDFQSGQARLSIEGLQGYGPKAATGVRGSGTHRVAFANIDQQLLVWINGSPVEFDAPTTYPALDNERPRADAQEPGDLMPARIGSQAAGLRVSRLQLWRDLYYIAARPGGPVCDYDVPFGQWPHMTYQQVLDFWSTPAMWAAGDGFNPFDQRHDAVYPLSSDQFFVLGDNSPLSQDARLWPAERYVSRDLLVGKALYVFWPHSFNRIPGTSIPFPFFPNFARMGFIR
jgi:signal peptidase I